MLEGRDLVAGLGLAAFILIRLPAAASGTVLNLLPTPGPPTLLGLAGFFAAAVPLAFATGAGACWITTAADGRRNMPLEGSQSKYRCPWTLPSFLPSKLSNSTPTQSPSANSVCPTYRTIPIRPSASWTVWPTVQHVSMEPSWGSLAPPHAH